MIRELTEFSRACDWLARTLGEPGEHIRRLGLDLAEAAHAQGKREMMQ